MKHIYVIFATLSWPLLINAQVPAGAVAYWPLDGNAQDLSGNGSHGTVTAAVPANDRFGQPNKAFRFNGINSRIDVSHNSFVDMSQNSDFSISYWQKVIGGSPNSVIITKHSFGSWSGYNFICGNTIDPGYCNTPGHMYWYVAAGGGQDACSDGPITYDTAWHCIVGVYRASSNESVLYIDGIVQSDIGSASGSISNNSNLNFGYEDDNNCCFFNGVIDQVRIYKRVLTQQEITALCNEPMCQAPLAPTNTTSPAAAGICKNTSTVLRAVGAGTLQWYSSPSSTLAIATGSAFATPTLVPGVYSYYVSANTCTNSPRTLITLTVSQCLGVDLKPSTNDLYNLYPNPGAGEFTLYSDNFSDNTQLLIFDQLGTLLLTRPLDMTELKVSSGLKPGSYVVIIKEGEKTLTRKKILITD